MTDLDKLIAAVEAGTVDFNWGFAASPSRKALPMHWHDAMNAYLGSLDAAHRLHEALLPGWYVAEISEAAFPLDHDGKHWLVAVAERDGKGLSEINGPTMARSWLLAILRALKAQGELK